MAIGLYQKCREKFYDWLIYEPSTEEAAPYDFNRLKHEIRPGDVLLVEGRSRVSSIIRTITQSPWTHSALYVGRLVDIEDPKIKEKITQHLDVKEDVRLIFEDCLDKGGIMAPLSSYKHHHIRQTPNVER